MFSLLPTHSHRFILLRRLTHTFTYTYPYIHIHAPILVAYTWCASLPLHEVNAVLTEAGMTADAIAYATEVCNCVGACMWVNVHVWVDVYECTCV